MTGHVSIAQLREPKRKPRAPLDERDANILRDIRAKVKTVADCYDIKPEYVVGVLMRAMK